MGQIAAGYVAEASNARVIEVGNANTFKDISKALVLTRHEIEDTDTFAEFH